MGLVARARATLLRRLIRLLREGGIVLPAGESASGASAHAARPLRCATSTADVNLGML